MIQLDQKYDREQFLSFLKEAFLKDFAKDVRPVGIDNFKAIKKAYTLGSSSDLDLQVFEFEYSGSFNKRIALAKEAFQVMKQSATFQALAIFYSSENDDWRFSLMTANPQRTEKGNITVAYSNPRRYSFFLGPNAKTNTPTKFLIKKGMVIDFEDLKSRFSLEVVNKEFYKEIAECYTKLVGGTRGEGRNKKTYDSMLKLPAVNEHSQTSIEFAVRLIGRIIFCWFLREKVSESGSSLMPKELLSLQAISDRSDYYHVILEPIFFWILNKSVKSRLPAHENNPFSKIPYLNGGLFSPHDDDFFSYNEGKQAQNHNTVVVPDSWLKELFEILETYNFTIDENTSIDEELSIDPEMLGRIFENLLAEINPETGESARKSTGSYYTPRVVVDYMVDESLILYLKQKTNIGEDKLRAVISYDLSDDYFYPLNEDEKKALVDAIEKVKILDPACGSGAFPIGALQKIVFVLQQIDPDGKIWFEKQLAKASPEFRRDIESKFSNNELDFIRKIGIIRESIFGIDIQPIATEISRLRCFLTLIVDEKITEDAENRGIKPLPNLDFKFVTANSLLGLPDVKKNQMTLFDDSKKIEELKDLRNQYFNSIGEERVRLILEFSNQQTDMVNELIDKHGFMGAIKAELTRKLTDWKPFKHKSTSWFDAEWMFGINDGFDIVIANPPYVGEKGHKDLFREIKNSTLGSFYLGKMDLFYFFFHLALNLTKQNGVIAFISTNYYPTASGAKKLRKDIKNRSIVHRLINFNELKIFKSATGQHNMITMLIKESKPDDVAKITVVNREGDATAQVLESVLEGHDSNSLYIETTQSKLFDGPEYYIRLANIGSDSSDPIQGILNKIKSKGEILGKYAYVNQGVVSGCDYVSRKNISKLNSEEVMLNDGIYVFNLENQRDVKIIDSFNQNEKKLLRPFYKNSDIRRYWSKTTPTKLLLYSTEFSNLDESSYPEITKHFLKFKPLLVERLKTYGENYNWQELHRARSENIFTGEKIVVPYRSRINTFAYNTVDWFCRSDSYVITQKDRDVSLKYLLAVLNSSLYFVWLYHRGKRKGEILELFQIPLTEIPIKKIDITEQAEYITLVDKIMNITDSEDYFENTNKQNEVGELEGRIDKMVFKLFELTNEEIELLESKIPND